MIADLDELRRRLMALGYLFAEEDNEAAFGLEQAALELALSRAVAFVEQFCNRLPQAEKAELPLVSAFLDLAAAYFLQSRLA